ncbi:MAG: hypothetical protein Q9162_003942 [Coniocarpon cinnabarinum]
MGPQRTHVLFVTTHRLDSPTHKNWNLELLDALKARSIPTTCHALLENDEELTSAVIARTFTHVCFLLLGDYPTHHATFSRFLSATLEDALILNPSLRVLNGPTMAAWNSDKQYLEQLSKAGFAIPSTAFLHKRQPLEYLKMGLYTQCHGNPVVIKPSISASGARTHLVQNPQQLTAENEDFLASIVNVAISSGKRGSLDADAQLRRISMTQQPNRQDAAEEEPEDNTFGCYMMQEFIPEIGNGEYSLIFVGGSYLYTVLKKPRAGGWQVGSAFGATFEALPEEEVPQEAKKLGHDLVRWINERFQGESVDYARVDGIMRNDGTFTLMEVELIEPSLLLSLDVGKRACDALCDLITGSAVDGAGQ